MKIDGKVGDRRLRKDRSSRLSQVCQHLRLVRPNQRVFAATLNDFHNAQLAPKARAHEQLRIEVPVQ
jgi:hypothetical protein